MTLESRQSDAAQPSSGAAVPSLDLERWAMEMDEFVRDISAELSDIATGLDASPGAERRMRDCRPAGSGEPDHAGRQTAAATENGRAQSVTAEPPTTGSGPVRSNFPEPSVAVPVSDTARQTGNPVLRPAPRSPVEPAAENAPNSSRLQSLMDRLESVRLPDPDNKDSQ